jgi:tetratricopeptide (TPR) repeat protein
MKYYLTSIFILTNLILQSQVPEKLQSYFESREWVKVIEEGKTILKDDPDNIIAKHYTGRALVELKRFGEAIDYLEETKKGKGIPEWMKGWSYGYLGLCYYGLEKHIKARSNLKSAIKLEATINSTDFARKLMVACQMTKYFDDWELIETEHIRFHIQPGCPISDIKEYCMSREEAYMKVNSFFNASPYKKVDFFLWSKPNEGKQIIGKEIGFSNTDLCIINASVGQTRGHELTHILCQYGIIPKIKNYLINEGVAVAFDQSDKDRMELARAAYKPGLSIKEIMKKNERDNDELIYPIGGALISFLLNKGGADKLKLLLHEQTWDKLIELYGMEAVNEFESLLSAN